MAEEAEQERTEHAPAGPLSAQLGIFGTIDTALYRVEVVIIVTALVLMSIMVFTDVAYQLAVTISQYLDKGDSAAWTTLGAVLGFVALMAAAATGRDTTSSLDEDDDEVYVREAKPAKVRIGAIAGSIVATMALGWALLQVESSTFYQALLVSLSIPIARTFWKRGDKKGLGIFCVSAALAFLVFGSLPTGYSWSQSYSLIMLLWVGFLGASIAARERRHLRIDLVRKLLPADKLPWFNAVSYLLAAAFTTIVVYLGFIYMVGPDSTYLRPIWDAPGWLPDSTRTMLMEEFPLPQDASTWRRAMQVVFAPSEPGELPDWLKVAAIPISMLLVCVRFLGHAFVFARMGLNGESFSEEMGAH